MTCVAYRGCAHNDVHDQRIRENFMSHFCTIEANYRRREREWIENLRRFGVKGAHPDDGWVSRTLNEMSPCYPQFWSATVGDLVALGTHERFRLVKLVAHRRGVLDLDYWKFVEIGEAQA